MKRWLAAIAALLVTLSGAAGLAEFTEGWTVATVSHYQTAIESGGFDLYAAYSSGDLRDKYGAYVAGNAFDRNPATTWAEASSGNGEGEWLQGQWSVRFGQWNVVGIALQAGYQKSWDVYSKNNRPGEVEIEIETGGEARDYLVDLDDVMAWQYVLFDDPMPADEVVDARLTLWSVYSGSKYRDTCVTEFDLLVAPATDVPDLSEDGGAQAGGWFGGENASVSGSAIYVSDGADSGEASPYAGRILYALYYGISDEEARAQIDEWDSYSDRCNNIYGAIGGEGVGYVGMLDLPQEQLTARMVLENMLSFTWYEEGSSGIEPLLTSDAEVTLVKSELYAWNRWGVQPTSVDEYYLFEIEKGGVVYDVIYNAGYEMDGGDWSEGRVLGSR